MEKYFAVWKPNTNWQDGGIPQIYPRALLWGDKFPDNLQASDISQGSAPLGNGHKIFGESELSSNYYHYFFFGQVPKELPCLSSKLYTFLKYDANDIHM